MNGYFDRQGRPISLEEFGRLHSSPDDYKRVAKDEVGDVLVSTVWLGSNHNFYGGAPLIFETMVFGGKLDEEQARYVTEDQAIAGHAAMVKRVKEAANG